MAPDAKLAFVSLGSTGAENDVFTPQSLASGYFPFTYAVGARVHSDSWGSSSTAYDYMASQVDQFSWDHQVPFERTGAGGSIQREIMAVMCDLGSPEVCVKALGTTGRPPWWTCSSCKGVD